MRILLTGTSGQVGGALRTALQGKGDLLTPQRAELDLSRPQGLAGALDALAPQLIINPAGYTAVDRAEDEVELAFRVNVEAPTSIARWAAPRGVPLVHFSTDYVFSGSGERPWREDDPCEPLSMYGKSKLAGEWGVRSARGSHLIVRTSWVYAAHGANFFRTMIRLARERSELRVVADQIGSPTSARSIAAAVHKLIPNEIDDMHAAFSRAGGLLHLTNSDVTSWYGFASGILDGLRARDIELKATEVIPIVTKDFPTKAVRPLNSRLDLTRLRDVFGISTPSWQDALAGELDAFVRAEREAWSA